MAKHDPSMKGLEMPEDMNVNDELKNQLIGESLGTGIGQMSNHVNMLAESSFAYASTKYAGIEKVDDLAKAKAQQKKEEEEDFMRGAYKPGLKENKKSVPEGAGITIHGRFFSAVKIIRNAAIIIAVLVIFILFIPPMFYNVVKEAKSETNNIFSEKGINDVRVYYENNYNIISPDAFKSEKYENYRELLITFKVVNLSPLQTKIPQYTLAQKQSVYSDRIVYVGNANTRQDDVIQPFSAGDIQIKALINVEGLDNADYNKLVRGMIFQTEEMSRKINKTTFCPTLPVFLFVSDSVSVELDR